MEKVKYIVAVGCIIIIILIGVFETEPLMCGLAGSYGYMVQFVFDEPTKNK